MTRLLRTRPLHRAGFTLVELITVMLLIGILAAFVMPRALDLTTWRLRAFGDELGAQMHAMQRLALVQRRPVVATISGSGVAFAYVAGGALVNVDCPPSASPCIAEPGPRSVTFNASNSGSAATSTGAALPVTVASGSSSKSFVIETETGLFRHVP